MAIIHCFPSSTTTHINSTSQTTSERTIKEKFDTGKHHTPFDQLSIRHSHCPHQTSSHSQSQFLCLDSKSLDLLRNLLSSSSGGSKIGLSANVSKPYHKGCIFALTNSVSRFSGISAIANFVLSSSKTKTSGFTDVEQACVSAPHCASSRAPISPLFLLKKPYPPPENRAKPLPSLRQALVWP